jgi:lipase chaperone LimK
MKKQIYIWLSVIALALVAGLVVFGPARHKDTQQASPASARNESAAADVSREDASSEDPEQQPAAEVSTPVEESVVARDVPVAQSNDKTFRVDASGRLVLDESTRLNMEALFARTERDQLAEAKQQAIEPLPAAAGAQAAELLEHYDNYQQAQKQSYPPGVAPETEEAALAELDGLHALRVAHFGPVVAHALYGGEEAVSRKLVELMRLEKDQSLTVEEKAERAQQLLESTQTERP